MRLIAFILLTVSINTYAQSDSTVLLEKKVVQCLIAGHYTAAKLSEENAALKLQKEELTKQINLYRVVLSDHREDSVLCDSLVSLNEGVAKTWKESYEAEKRFRKHAQRQVRKLTATTILATALSIALWFL
jgi:hypothetical protein